jgi:predicted RecA/RadA family phage recombinase
MKNYLQPGCTLTFTAPAGGVTTGVAVLIGALVVIPATTAAAGETFEGALDGVYENQAKTDGAGSAWTVGAPLYFDSATSEFTYVQSATARRCGVAVEAAADGDVTGTVKLLNIGAAVNVA